MQGQNSAGTSGGGLYGSGAHTITNMWFGQDTAAYGGGAYLTGTATVMFTNFSSNVASQEGGALFLTGTASLQYGSIYNTDAGVRGAGIRVLGGTLSLDNFYINYCDLPGYSNGGGIYGSGGGSITLRNTDVGGNKGGGVWTTGTALDIATSYVSSNWGDDVHVGWNYYYGLNPADTLVCNTSNVCTYVNL